MNISKLWEAVPPIGSEVSDETKWILIKLERTRRIEAVEKYLRPDVPISFTKRQEIAEYIQTLRDVPQNFSNPDLVQFPLEVTYG